MYSCSVDIFYFKSRSDTTFTKLFPVLTVVGDMNLEHIMGKVLFLLYRRKNQSVESAAVACVKRANKRN